MKRVIPIILLLAYISIDSSSQVLRGNIGSATGDPIQYATVYIREIKQGTTANTKGDYELRLHPGKYTVTYQSMGYEPVFVDVEISGNQIVTKNIVLPVQYYQIPEVRISATGEDPAYIIMRKVIGMAPYYLNNVSSYKAEVYLKGNLLINRIPKLLQRSMKAQQKKEGSGTVLREGDSYFMESYNEIDYTAPDKYFQKVLSIHSTFPEEGNEISPMSFINASFYQPEIADMAISPLAPSAFSHYNFRYSGVTFQGDYAIDKISVIPKRKSQQLFEGTIYIIEDLWCLQSVDLVNENLAAKIRVQQLYIPVQDDIWMPVSHKFEVNISIMGVKADATYGSSVKYLELKPNLALQKPSTASTNFTSVHQPPDTVSPSKNTKKIEKILGKEEMSNSDMIKLSKLMKKEAEGSLQDTIKKNLEIKEKVTHKIEKDANKKDSAYWAGIRPIPLSDIEKRSIKLSDSVKTGKTIREMKRDTIPAEKKEEKKKSKFFTTVKQIATGYSWSDTTGKTFRFGGLVNLKNFSFNTVDGFVYGMDFNLTKTYGERVVYIAPEFKWAFSRQQPIWSVNSYFKFNRWKQDQIYIRTGQESMDINRGGGINLFLNTDFSLTLKKNHLKLYQSGFLTLGYITALRIGLSLETAVTYEDRGLLNNSTNFSFFSSSRQYTPNVPVNPYLAPGAYPLYALRNMRHADFLAKITYTPYMKYRLQEKKKIPMGSDWPTFTFTWMHGLNEFTELAKPIRHFDMLRFEAGKRKDLGAFSEIRWRVRTGGFINNKYVTFYDFYHVNSQPLPVLINNYEDAFMLPAFYSLSTPELYLQAHTKYTAPFLALKYLPFLSNTLIRENLTLAYLGSRKSKNYTEIGYSLSEIFLLAEIGIYVGFEDVAYRSAGVSLTLNLH